MNDHTKPGHVHRFTYAGDGCNVCDDLFLAQIGDRMNHKYWCCICGHTETNESSIRPSHCGNVMKAQGRADKRKTLPHPIQPLEDDGNDVIRFKPNEIVRYLLDNGGIDMNQIAGLNFSREDYVQFAQLIGYSLSGFGELSYVNDEDYDKAEKNLVIKKFPRCPECGGEVQLIARKGRTREYLPGVHLTIPDDFAIPTCTKCGEVSMTIEVSEPLDKLLGELLRSKLKES